MGNASSMKVVAVAFVTAISAHGGASAGGCWANDSRFEAMCENKGFSEVSCPRGQCHWNPTEAPGQNQGSNQGSDQGPAACQQPIGQAVDACKPWVSKTCPQAVEMEHMAECFLRNRSTAPKTCRMAAQNAFACATKEDATEECVDEFGTKNAGPCMQCEVASREAEVQCTETWFELCAGVDPKDMSAAKECFMKNQKAFPAKCQRAVQGMVTGCKLEEQTQEQQDHEEDEKNQQAEKNMEILHREQEEKMQQMYKNTVQNDRANEQKEIMQDRKVEYDHKKMHAGMTGGAGLTGGMTGEQHIQHELNVAKEHMHKEEHMAMENQMMTGANMMQTIDHNAEQLMTESMNKESELNMKQEDIMHYEHKVMASAPVDSRPITKMTKPAKF